MEGCEGEGGGVWRGVRMKGGWSVEGCEDEGGGVWRGWRVEGVCEGGGFRGGVQYLTTRQGSFRGLLFVVSGHNLLVDRDSYYSGTCLRWSLCKAAASLKQPASLVRDSTKALESISVEQPPLYNGQLELAHRLPGFIARFHCTHV